MSPYCLVFFDFVCLYVHAYMQRRIEWREGEKVLINLLLLKQSKCKLDLSICMFQDVMRFEFKWPACVSSTLRGKLKFKEGRVRHKQSEIMAVIELRKLRMTIASEFGSHQALRNWLWVMCKLHHRVKKIETISVSIVAIMKQAFQAK